MHKQFLVCTDDGHPFEESGDQSTTDSRSIHLTGELGEFPHCRRSLKFVLVGGKGVGKTLLLQAKSHYYRHARPDFFCLPERRPCESILSFLYNYERSWGEDLSKVETWTAVWETVITLVCIRFARAQCSERLNELVPDELRSASDTIAVITQSLSGFQRCKQLVMSDARPAFATIGSRIALFLDSADESLSHLLASGIETIPSADSVDRQVREKVWIAGQLGLVEAIRELRQINPNIEVFSAIRREAFEQYPYHAVSKLREMCTVVSYSDQDLIAIFRKRFGRLCGTGANCARHLPKAVDVDAWASSADEWIESLVLRHSLGRPQDIMRLGHAISNVAADHCNDMGRLAREVLNISDEIYRDYKIQCVPAWDNRYEAVLGLVRSPVPTSADVAYATKVFLSTFPSLQDPFIYFANHGLLGHVEIDYAGNPVQRFLDADSYISNFSRGLASSSMYFFHPCIAEKITATKSSKSFSFESARPVTGRNAKVIWSTYPSPSNLRCEQLMVKISRGCVSVSTGEPNGSASITSLNKLGSTLAAGALGAFARTRVSRLTFDSVGEEIDILVDRGMINRASIKASTTASVSLGLEVVARLNDEKCWVLEEANKFLKQSYPGRTLLLRTCGMLVLNFVNPDDIHF